MNPQTPDGTMESVALPQKCIDSQARTREMGYIAYINWMEKKSKSFYQVKCEHCGLFHIWKRKALKGETE